MSLSLRRTRRRELALTPSCLHDLQPKILSPGAKVVKKKKNGRERPSLHAIFGIHLLPPEVLAHMFVLGSLDDVMLPIYVSHVCSLWRSLALNTPALWRRIVLDGRDRMWKERIYRAKACTLDVSLMPPSPRTSPLTTANDVQLRMHAILPHLHRLRSLSVVFSSDERSPYLCNSTLSPLCPSIHTIHNIHMTSRSIAPYLSSLILVHPANDDTKSFTLFGGSAPRLQRLTVSGIRLDWLPTLFGNLTYLNYTHHRFTHGFRAVREILSLLAVSSQLVQVRLKLPPSSETRRSWPPSPQSRVESGMVALNRLECLTLVADMADPSAEIECYSFLVWHLSLPSIRLLHLDNASSSPIVPRGSLRSFLNDYTGKLFQFWGADVFRGMKSVRVIRCAHGWYADGRPALSFITTRTLPKLRRIEAQRREPDGTLLELVHRTR